MKALLVGIMACGIFSIPSLDIRGLPEVSCSEIMVEVEAPGLSASYLSDSVLPRTAEVLAGIEGLQKLYYGVFDGRVIFQLVTGTDGSDLSEIRRRLQGLRPWFPHQAGPPRIFALPRRDSSAVFLFALEKAPVEAAAPVQPAPPGQDARDEEEARSEEDARRARQMRELREELLEMPAVRTVFLRGLPDREIEVRIDPARLASAQLSPLTVEEALRRSLFKLSAGTLTSSARKSDLILDSGVDSTEDLRKLPVFLNREKNGSYVSLGEISRITWGPPLYRERIRLKGQAPGGILHIHFDPATGLFQRFRTLNSAARLLASRSWILHPRLIENSLTGSIGPLLFLLFGTLSTAVFLFRVRPFLQILAPPAVLITFHGMTGKILCPDALMGMGTAALLSVILPLSALPTSRPLRLSRRIVLFLAAAVLLPVGTTVGLPSQRFFRALILQILIATLLEGIYRYTERGKRSSAPHRFGRLLRLSPYLPSFFRFRFAVIFALTVFTAAVPLNREYFQGLQLYAVLPLEPARGLDPAACKKSVFTMDYPREPPDSFSFQTEHWLAGIDPDFFVAAFEGPENAGTMESTEGTYSADLPEGCFPGALIIPISGFGKNNAPGFPLGKLFDRLADRTCTHDSHQSSPYRKSIVLSDDHLRLKLVPEKLADSNLSRPVVLHHLELAFQGIEAGQIEGPHDDRSHTVRLLYGEYEGAESLLKLPVFPGDTLPLSLGAISSLSQERRERVFAGEVLLK